MHPGYHTVSKDIPEIIEKIARKYKISETEAIAQLFLTLDGSSIIQRSIFDFNVKDFYFYLDKTKFRTEIVKHNYFMDTVYYVGTNKVGYSYVEKGPHPSDWEKKYVLNEKAWEEGSQTHQIIIDY